jgi:hypothetical protein
MAFKNLTTIVTIVIEQCLARKDLVAFKKMADILALGIWLTSSSINFLLSSTIFLHLSSVTR